MKYIGIDFGTKKIGVALSSDAGTMGFPHSVILNSARAHVQVAEIITKEGVAAIVIGESRNFQGEENSVAEAARAFARALSERCGIPVHFETETLTTQEARRFPDGSRMKGSPNVDASAAALILTNFLQRTAPNTEQDEEDHSHPEQFQKKEGSRYTDHHDID